MKILVLCLLFCLAVSQMTDILLSSAATMSILRPANYFLRENVYLNQNWPDRLGNGAIWVFMWAGDFWAGGTSATFFSLFQAQCTSPAKLRINADNMFTAILNGKLIGSGDDFYKIQEFDITVLKGRNNFTTEVTNDDEEVSTVGVVFSISQDLSYCREKDCSINPLAYYDQQTKKCECSNVCACPSGKHWLGYPDCGCKCTQHPLTTCGPKKHWYTKTCSCRCNDLQNCPQGQAFDHSTCSCIASCQNKCCPTDTHLDTVSCSCIAD